MMKKLSIFFVVLCLLLCCIITLCSCSEQLDAPSNFRLDGDTLELSWDKVRGATAYTVTIGDKTKTTKAASYSLAGLAEGEYDITVTAIGDGDTVKNSDPAVYSFKRGKESGLLYKLINNNTEYQLAGIGSAGGDVVMESEFRKKPVTSIAEAAIANNSRITSFEIASTIKTIPKKAFYNCNAMTTVVIPEGVTHIAENAFQSCKALTRVTVPESVTEISDYAFSYCRALEEVKLSSETTSIGAYAFSDCSVLKAINLPDTVKTIGDYAFSGCKSAAVLVMSKAVESIGDYAFYGCELIPEVNLGEGLESIGERAFEYCKAIKSVVIPESAKRIGNRAFTFCESLESVLVGEGIEYIGRDVLLGTKYYDETTDSIVYLGNWIVGCKDKAIQTGLDLTTLINEGTVGIADFAFSQCNGFTGVTLPDIKYVGQFAFFQCEKLMEVKLGEGAKRIDDYAFMGCKILSTVLISKTEISYIGDYAFNGCERLKNIDLPDTVESIGTYAFGETGLTPSVDGVIYADKWAVGCTGSGINNITLKDGTVGIADYSFFMCPIIQSVKMPDTVRSIGRGAFMLCQYIYITEFPEQLEKIDDYAFYGCTGAVFGNNYDLVLPEGLTYIGRSAFYQSQVVGIEIPGTCKYIGDYAFFDCGYLGAELEFTTEDPEDDAGYGDSGKEVVQYHLTLNEGIEYIGTRAFYGCVNLRELTIPNSVTELGIRAFVGCESLTRVKIGRGLSEIPDYTFLNCSALKSVYMQDNIQRLGRCSFRGCSSLADLGLGNGVSEIGVGALWGCSSLKTLRLPEGVMTLDDFALRANSSLDAIIIHSGITELGQHAIYGDLTATVYCEAEYRPDGWHRRWNSSFRPTVWGCTLSEDKSYVVSFVKNEGSIENFDAIGGVNDPVRRGSTFLGWSTTADGAAEYTTAELATVNNGTTLYAVWQTVTE